MGTEIERKFLVNHEEWNRVTKPEGTHYRQAYILNNERKTVRVRVSNTKGFLNLKSRISAVSRKEYEYEIPLTDAIELLDTFTENGTEKVRYRITFANNTWEIDVFAGPNQGLIIAEIELESEEQSFEKPDWISTEVTDDSRYTNASLAIHPFKDW